MKKMIFCIILALLLILMVCCSKADSFVNDESLTLENCLEYDNNRYIEIEHSFIDNMVKNGLTNYKVYDSSELSADILENRNGTVIIERCIGFVTDALNGDGKVLNAYDEAYDYIGYRGITYQKYYNGTVFLTYLIYNPNNNYIDDIIARYDFVLCRNWENRGE